jgi:hypothetical protein
MRLAVVVLAAVACGDSTDIAGTYVGNATYTRSDGTTGAGMATVVVTDTGNNNVDVAIGAACTLAANEIEQVDISDHRNYGNFVLTSEAIRAQQPCALPDGTIAVAAGDLVVDAGLTMTLDLGGPTTDGGGGSAYVVYHFDGAAD